MAWVNRRRVEDGSWRYTAVFRDPAGRQRSAGTFRTRHEGERAGTAAEIRMAEGSWVERQAGRITFTDYVERHWWPSRHLEISTRSERQNEGLDHHPWRSSPSPASSSSGGRI